MRVVTMQILTGDQSVQDALEHIKSPGDSVLIADREETRLVKASQLTRVKANERRQTKLRTLPWESTWLVFKPELPTLQRHHIRAAGPDLKGDVGMLSSEFRHRFLLVQRGQINYLISSSEDNLVDYHCEKNHHPWGPPPPMWTPSTTCDTCGSRILRDG